MGRAAWCLCRALIGRVAHLTGSEAMAGGCLGWEVLSLPGQYPLGRPLVADSKAVERITEHRALLGTIGVHDINAPVAIAV